jgi:site-specific DNA-methyltransferase (adenine-specific)
LIIWAAPRAYEPTRHFFRYGELKAENEGKQLRDMWEISTTRASEKRLGGHPTQKPLALLRRIMAATAPEGGLVLDPFCGSGTTGVAAIQAKCSFLGFDLEKQYVDLAHARCSAAFQEGTLIDGDDFQHAR